MVGRKKVILTLEQVQSAYLNKDASLADAAKELGCSVPVVARTLKLNGLSSKPANWNQALIKANKKPIPLKFLSKEDIERVYINQPVNINEAIAILGTSQKIMARSMKKYGILPKEKHWNHGSIGSFYPKLEDKEWLKNELETKSKYQVAKDLGCSWGAVHYYTKKHQI